MDPILQTLLSWQFILFSLSISAVVFVVKTVAEYLMSTYAVLAKESAVWNKLILPILPIVWGGLLGFIFRRFPYPDALTHAGDRIMFGLVSGLLSTFIYSVVKGLLGQKIGTIFGSGGDSSGTSGSSSSDVSQAK